MEENRRTQSFVTPLSVAYVNSIREEELESVNSPVSNGEPSEGFGRVMFLSASSVRPETTPANGSRGGFAEFRRLPVIPRLGDLTSGLPGVTSNESSGNFDDIGDVPVNLVDGPYDSADQYLDTHFRLVREDFVRPFRASIESVLTKVANPYGLPPRVYEDVVVKSLWCLKGNISLLVSFNSAKLGRVDWKISKRLMHGSLLCLTRDNFRSVHFATVADSNPDTLSKGMLLLNIEWPDERYRYASYEFDIKKWLGKPWLAVESPGFFVAYRHVLANLKELNLNRFPIARCILRFEGGSALPRYLRNSLAFGKELNLPEKTLLFAQTLDVTGPADMIWPTATSLGFDDAQCEAFKVGLMSELAVIQGPPGTGKTYLGLKIVETLLMNRCWGRDTPVLVVCYTNHALDQFLEGMLGFTQNIVRIGGRCQNDRLARFHIRNWLARKREEDRSCRRGREERAASKEFKTRLSEKLELQKLIQSHLMLQSILLSGAGLMRLSLVLDYSTLDFRLAKDFSTMEWLGLGAGDALEPGFVAEVLRVEKAAVAGNTAAALGQGSDDSLIGALDKGVADLSLDSDSVDSAISDDVFLSVASIPSSSTTTTTAAAAVGADVENNVVYESTAESGLRQVDDWYEFDGDDDGHFRFYSDGTLSAEEQGRQHDRWFETSVTQCQEKIRALQARIRKITQDREGQERRLTAMKKQAADDKGKRAAVLLAIEEFDKKCRTFDAILANLDEDICEAVKLMSILQSAVRLLRMPWGVDVLPEPASGVPRTYDELVSLRLVDRWLLYRHLVSIKLEESRGATAGRLPSLFLKAVEEVEALRNDEAVALLRTMDVVGMTTTGASRDIARLRKLGPKIVIFEEAAEVFESSIVTSLTESCEHVILIGDHQQLRPKPDVYELATRHKMDVSLFERLIRNGFPHVTLETQHRMRPEVADLVRPHIYATLKDHDSVRAYPHVPGVACDVFFVTHSEPERKDSESKSPENPHEVEFLLALCQYLVIRGLDPSQITILAPYARQINRFSQSRAKYPLTREVKITTVDNFQGEENEVILLSLVRSNPQKDVGFLNCANRVNVALSRAKHGLFIVGNMTSFARPAARPSVWTHVEGRLRRGGAIGPRLPLYCELHNVRFGVGRAADFPENGGCGEICGVIMECGHVCVFKCHGADAEHVTPEFACPVRVRRRCDRDEHDAEFVCGWTPDRRCKVPCLAELPCGHAANDVPCHCLLAGAALADWAQVGSRCRLKCCYIHERCGHPCQLRCGHVFRNAIEQFFPELVAGTYDELRYSAHNDFCSRCGV